MNKAGPIVIIEDDTDDIDVYVQIFDELGTSNEIKIFSDGEKALSFLKELEVKPFLILSDINMPGRTGFQLREVINADPSLHRKCIPYIFYTTDASPQSIEKAYMLSVQGIFQKPANYEKWKQMIGNMVDYWNDCMSPPIR